MGYKKRTEQYEEFRNKYNESQQRQAQVIREEEEKRNTFHGNTIQLYKSKRKRDRMIKKAQKNNLNAALVNKAQEISNRKPFDINTVSMEDLECLHQVDVFAENVSNENAVFKIFQRIEERTLGTSHPGEGGDL